MSKCNYKYIGKRALYSVKVEYTDCEGGFVKHTFVCPVSDSSVDGMEYDLLAD